ncbi:SH3 domain-containing protein [bacterium]|nr:SH3 domain-containing protein [bacterium]
MYANRIYFLGREMIRKYWMLFIMLGLLGASAPRIVEGPETMPNVSSAMRTPEYWINRIPAPDQELFLPDERARLRRCWQEEKLLLDLSRFPKMISRDRLKNWLTADYKYLERAACYGLNGRRWGARDYQSIKKNVNPDSVQGSKKIAWGMTVRRTALRLFPTNKTATIKPRDLEFDVFSHSGLSVAEPVAIMHISADKKWYYIASEIGRGWARTRDIGRAGSRGRVFEYQRTAGLTVIAAEVYFFREDGGKIQDSARMGCRLQMAGNSETTIHFPRRNARGELFFMRAVPREPKGVIQGPRPCTPRVIIEQAFILLDQPYGWGGAGGYDDCSEFIRRVGRVCGLALPRNTINLGQALPGKTFKMSGQSKQSVLAALPAGASFICLPGHVMLVLGSENQQTYVIHNLYGIQARDSRGDYIRRVGRVVVSDLSLGAGSRRGSLFQRVERALFLRRVLDK